MLQAETAYGVEPLLSFDILLAMFLFPEITRKVSESKLLYMHTYQLEKWDKDLANLEHCIIRARFQSIKDFQQRFMNTIHNYNFKPGILVLVFNKKIKVGTNRKFCSCHFSLMVVVQHIQGGAYYLAELDGTVSRLKFAAFWLVLYYARSRNEFKIAEFTDTSHLMGLFDDSINDI
ncbi:uncharacterized protein BT62DRAFT_981827 [Guyanagaster necrorhizus]|uniref:Uncharacterized protein n=1 Tax=Guyanagaster necrorhizus TaxID=856835 RepID=A0A9P8AQQ3_9AGAR|nr:uncharacterized protein BT62DRAFT_981827 [Guyanagaster necrorhizus MCA 3950]KAG7444245.1 hypothetical protein BT62DRAFT_981827 [Guyanagaster necrorhizus MCA 3950]